MKTLLSRVGLLEGNKLNVPVVLFSTLCKILMVATIAFLVYLLTSRNYTRSSIVDNEIDTSQNVTSNPPSPLE